MIHKINLTEDTAYSHLIGKYVLWGITKCLITNIIQWRYDEADKDPWRYDEADKDPYYGAEITYEIYYKTISSVTHKVENCSTITKEDPTPYWVEISYDEYIGEAPLSIETQKELIRFEIGKYYRYETKDGESERVAIRGVLNTISGSNTLIAELRSGILCHATWLTEQLGDNVTEFCEITAKEFYGVTKLEIGKYYKNDASSHVHVLAFVKDNAYAVENRKGLLSIVYGDAGKTNRIYNWHEITKEEFLA